MEAGQEVQERPPACVGRPAPGRQHPGHLAGLADGERGRQQRQACWGVGGGGWGPGLVLTLWVGGDAAPRALGGPRAAGRSVRGCGTGAGSTALASSCSRPAGSAAHALCSVPHVFGRGGHEGLDASGLPPCAPGSPPMPILAANPRKRTTPAAIAATSSLSVLLRLQDTGQGECRCPRFSINEQGSTGLVFLSTGERAWPPRTILQSLWRPDGSGGGGPAREPRALCPASHSSHPFQRSSKPDLQAVKPRKKPSAGSLGMVAPGKNKRTRSLAPRLLALGLERGQWTAKRGSLLR